jgi:hypothetical protein
MITRHWSLLLVGLFGVFALGCASTRESMKPVGPADLTSLAGTWQGTASSAQALSQPVTIMLGTDGAYTMTAGVYTSQGAAQVTDSKLMLTSRSTTGGQTPDRQTGSRPPSCSRGRSPVRSCRSSRDRTRARPDRTPSK